MNSAANTSSNKIEQPATLTQAFSTATGEVHSYQLPFSDKTGTATFMKGDGFVLVEGVIQHSTGCKPWEHINPDLFVEMNFVLDGGVTQTSEGLTKNYLCQAGYNNILFNPGASEKAELTGNRGLRNFGIHVSPSKMLALLNGYVPELEHVAQMIDKQKAFVLHAPSNYIAPRLNYLFKTVWDYPQQAGLRLLHFESFLLEVLALQCNSILPPGAKSFVIDKNLKERLFAAKDILQNRLSNPPTISELSKLCGLNEFKLKKGFRQLFDTSILGYVNEQRMTAAYYSILERDRNISQIAYDLGFAHPQHFHRAFKKRFGITPMSVLKNV